MILQLITSLLNIHLVLKDMISNYNQNYIKMINVSHKPIFFANDPNTSAKTRRSGFGIVRDSDDKFQEHGHIDDFWP